MAKEEEKTEVKPTETKERFEMVEVPTQFGLGFRDNQTDETIDSNQLLLRLANDVQKIKKSVV